MGEVYKPSSTRDLKESGGWRLLLYGLLVFVIGYVAYSFGAISYGILLGLMALSLALALGAGVELRFYQLKLQLRNIERMLEELKSRQH
jgi:hypothetical protein